MILSRAVRRKIRRLREAAFLLRHRLRRRDEPVLLFRPASGDREEPLRHPAIRIVLPEDGEGVTAALEKQSETSWTCSGTTETPWIFYPGPGLSGAAPAMLEGLLLSGVCCGLDVVRTDPACGTLLRTPGPKPGSGLGYGGKTPGGVLKSFRGWLSAEAEVREIRIELHDPEQVLGGLPGLPGQRTAVIVLPFLAVGGAEQLLFDLLRSWAGKYRVLLVTLDEHRKELGSSTPLATGCHGMRASRPCAISSGDGEPRVSSAGMEVSITTTMSRRSGGISPLSGSSISTTTTRVRGSTGCRPA